MRYVTICVAIACLGFTLIAGAEDPEMTVKQVPLGWEQAALSDGEALYAELCATCHGKNGVGDGPAAKALAIAVPDLTLMASSAGGEFPAERAEQAIRGDLSMAAHGSKEMPIWGMAFRDVRPDWKPYRREGFAELRIHALVLYVESLQVGAEAQAEEETSD